MLKDYFADKRQQMIELLTTLIEYESPSHDKAAVDRLGAYLQDVFKEYGAEVETHAREAVGDILLAKWQVDLPAKPILILAHMDTVWSVGTLETMPIRRDNEGRLFGPGAIDMKGGIVIALEAVRGLQERGELPQRPIWFLVTSDEETGSRNSRELIETCAKDAALVLVMEPPTADGSLKTWRKGVARYDLIIEGRAAHAGNEPELGVNSIIEFAHQALELNQLNDFKNGTSVSVTMVEGGIAANTIPPRTSAKIDVRMVTQKAYQQLHETIMDRFPHIPGSQITVKPQHYRPPMERDGAAFEQARSIATKLGITIREDGAGGGSDGNFTAALGIPTLDGLGAEGTGLHALHEHVLVNSLPKKAALVAGLMRDWQD